MKKIFLVIMLCHCISNLLAQTGHTVAGIVKDSAGQEIIAASITLITGKDTLHTSSNETGRFSFREVSAPAFSIRVSIIGYETWYRTFTFRDAPSRIELPPILLSIRANKLQEIVVKAPPAPVVVREDTLEFNADRYKLRENAVAEDLLKRLPGMDVDKDGNVSAQGKKITKVRVNGKDFVVSDLKSLTRLLPANMIDKVQVVDDYGYMARATGRKQGDPERIINISTKADLSKGVQGQVIAGAGNEGRYNAMGIANYFNGQQQVTFSGNMNNTSAQAGNVTSRMASVNYRDEPRKGLSLNGNFLAAGNSSNLQSYSTSETATSEGTLYSSNNTGNRANNNAYAFNTGLEYKPDEQNIMNFNVNLGLNRNNIDNLLNSSQSGLQRKDQVTANNTVASLPVIGSGLFISHGFRNSGRRLSLNLYVNYTGNSEDQDINDRVQYYGADSLPVKDSLLRQLIGKDNNTLMTYTQASYIEPIDSLSSLELKYGLNYTAVDSRQVTQWVDGAGNKQLIEPLSSKYSYKTAMHQLELNYRRKTGKFDYTLGVAWVPARLTGAGAGDHQQPHISSNSFVPVMRIEYKLPRSQFLTWYYYANILFPTYQQLQPVPDMTNAQFPIIGNPELKPSLNHSMVFSYRNFNPRSNNGLYANIFATYIQDKVVTNTVLVQDSFNTVKQETRFLNAGGNYTVRAVYGWNRRFSDGKYNLFLDGSAAYNNNVLYMQDVKDAAKNLVISQSARGGLLLDWLEMNGGVVCNYNRNAYDLSSGNTTTLTSWTLNIGCRFNFLKTFSAGGDASKQLNSGYTGAVAVNPLMANAYLEKMLFKKKLTCRFQVYNLLDESSRVTQSIVGNTVTNSRDNLISRYFMLTLQYDFRHFKGLQ